MNNKIIGGVVAIAALGASAAAWVALPALQADSQAVGREASWHTERARRLLHQYSIVLNYNGMLVEQLAEVGLEVDADELTDDLADEYQAIQEPLWEAYPPMNFRADSASPASPSYGNIERDIREGLREQQQHARDNARLLDDALAAVNDALAVTHGNADARSHAEANRLKGIILYYQGDALRLQAKLQRSNASGLRGELVALAGRTADAKTRNTNDALDTIDDRVSELRTTAGRIETTLGEERAALALVNASITKIERQLTDATARADAARQSMDELRTVGADLTDPSGAESFAERFGEVDRAFRAASREAHALEFGGIPKARLVPRGDYLDGEFVEGSSPLDVTVQHGLGHYRDQRAVLAGQVAGREVELEALKVEMDRRSATKDVLLEQQRRDHDELQKITESAPDLYDDMDRADAEAFAAEDGALQLFDQSARASQAAARGANEWVSTAQTATRQLSPESKTRSAFDTRTGDAWMSGHIAAQEGDALLAVASIQYDRFRTYVADADMLDRIAQHVALPEVDVETARTQAEDARVAGIEAVAEAMSILERAHRGTERLWTLTAQAASATDLLSMFGREDYVSDAIKAYGEAVKGRETEKSAQPFVARLNRLENR